MEAVKKVNLRHVAISIVIGYTARQLLSAYPELLFEKGRPKYHEYATPDNLGYAAAALSFYMLYSNKMEGFGGGNPYQTFYSATETLAGSLDRGF